MVLMSMSVIFIKQATTLQIDCIYCHGAMLFVDNVKILKGQFTLVSPLQIPIKALARWLLVV